MIPTPRQVTRRKFLSRLAIGVQAALGASVAVPALGAVAYPLWGKITRRVTGFVPVGPLSMFQPNVPRRVVVRGDRWDAWTREVGVVLGSAWVVRTGDDAFRVLSSTCPHLGCAVRRAPQGNGYLCPCHGSRFDEAGRRKEVPGKQNPSPRDMDPLEWKVERGQLLVRFAKFRTGTARRVEVG